MDYELGLFSALPPWVTEAISPGTTAQVYFPEIWAGQLCPNQVLERRKSKPSGKDPTKSHSLLKDHVLRKGLDTYIQMKKSLVIKEMSTESDQTHLNMQEVPD